MNQFIQIIKTYFEQRISYKLYKTVNNTNVNIAPIYLLMLAISIDAYRLTSVQNAYLIILSVNIFYSLLLAILYKFLPIPPRLVIIALQLVTFRIMLDYNPKVSLSLMLESGLYNSLPITQIELLIVLLFRFGFSGFDFSDLLLCFIYSVLMSKVNNRTKADLKNKFKLCEEILDCVNYGLISVKHGVVRNVNLKICDIMGKINNGLEDVYYTELKRDGKPIPSETVTSTFLKDVIKPDGNGSIDISLSELSENTQFEYLGKKKLTISNDSELVFEIWYRFVKKDKFIFLLKDTSDENIFTLLQNERNNKSAILSKVAHEFKNPLISIGELVDQLANRPTKYSSSNSVVSSFNEGLKNAKKTKFIIEDIKAYLKYLMLMIKDLNFSTKKELSSYEKTKCNIFSIVGFIQKVTNCLIRKYNKQTAVKFVVNVGQDVPRFINAYEDGLKQVLMNLITNAIKNTLHGSISLTISKRNETTLKFEVEDTGVGFKTDETMTSLASSSHQLGLSIVSYLTSKLGEPIQYESEINKGSRFWFSIPLDVCRDIIIPPKHFATEVSADDDTNSPLIDIISQDAESVIDNFDNDISFDSAFSKETVKIDNLTFSYSYEQLTSKTAVFKIPDFINYNPCGGLENKMFIIIVDDEQMTRLSNIRLFSEIATRDVDINILEAEDGIECLYFLFLCNKKGIKVSAIFSDQTMNYLDGSCTLSNINKLIAKKAICEVPFYILTAYEDESTLVLLRDSSPKEIFTKPFKRKIAEKIVAELSV
jgi:signal transduction histidine kinase